MNMLCNLVDAVRETPSCRRERVVLAERVPCQRRLLRTIGLLAQHKPVRASASQSHSSHHKREPSTRSHPLAAQLFSRVPKIENVIAKFHNLGSTFWRVGWLVWFGWLKSAMFCVCEIRDVIRLKAKRLEQERNEALAFEINKKFANKVIHKVCA